MRFTGETFDTTTLVQLTAEGRNFFPSWSPDGQWIAYDSNVDSPNGMKFIWKMKSDGTQKTRIAYDPTKGEIREPSWSSDGNKIVHTRYIGVGAPEVFTMDINGGNVIRLTNNTKDDRCPHNVFGNNIVFWSNGNLWMMDSSGSSLKQLSNQRIDHIFSVSPSEDKVVYTLYEPNNWTYENGTLWIIDLISGVKRQLTFNPKPNN
jgi:Tol biopolymer transport system component